MAPRTEKFAYRVELDGKTAAESLDILQKKSVELRAQMKKLKEANDLAGFEQVERQAKSVAREMKRYEVAVFDVQKVMNNLSGVMRRDLFTAQKALQRQLNDELTPGTKEYEAALVSLGLVQKRIIQLTREQKAAGKDVVPATEKNSLMSRVADEVNKYALMVGGAVLGLGALADKATEAVNAFNKFEQAKAELQSLTGVAKELRDEMGEFALEMSTSVVEGGVRITKTAVDIVDAFRLVGSQLPQLLDDTEALQQVTKDALILSEAAGGPLDSNVRGLSTVMNEFDLVTQDTNKTIRESHRVINILAAGAQAGAGEIPYLQEALEKAGTQANMFGISIENTVGIIETLAPRITEASKAGTGLRGVLIALETQTNNNFKPSIVGYTQAMNNLAAADLNATQLKKLFGEEQFTAGKILIKYRQETEAYTAAVTNSNKAIEQATINTDTNTAKLAQAMNMAEKNRIELGEKLAPVMLFVAQASNVFTRGLINLTKQFDGNADAVKKATDEYAKQNELVQKLDKSLQPLLGIYDTLKAKTTLTEKEQALLKTTISEIARQMPDAVSAFDSLGGALEINTGKARDLIENMRRVKEIMNEEVIKKNEEARNDTMVKQMQLGRGIQAQKENLLKMEAAADKLKGTKYYEDQTAAITTQRIQIMQLNRDWLALDDKVKSYNATINYLKGIGPLPPPVVTKPGVTDGTGTGTSEEDAVKMEKLRDKALSDLEAAKDRLRALNIQIQTSLKEGIDKDVFAIYQRYQKEIEIATENEAKKTDLSKDWGKVRQELELNRQQETDAAIKKFETEQEAAKRKQIEADELKRKALHDQLMATLDDQYTMELKKFQAALDAKIITEEEYHLLRTKLDETYAAKAIKQEEKTEKKRFEIVQQRMQAEMQITNALADFTQSRKDLELQNAGTNEEKKKQITKKYADIELAITEAKIIATTALAVMSALAMVPPNPFLAIAAGVTGGIEAATAVNQRNRIRGFEHGLYNVTRSDGMQYRAGVSTDTSTQMVSRPTVFMAGEGNTGIPEMIIDAGTLRRMQINYPEAIDAIHKSRSGGGGVIAGVSSSSSSHKEIIREVADAKTIEVIEELNSTLKKGIKTIWVYRDFKNFTDKVDASKNDFN